MPIRNVEEVCNFPKFPKAIRRRNVAAYARVSSGSQEQEHSLEAQKSYYETFIQNHETWNYVGLYVDDGITALNTNKRDGFNKLISDALSGKFDLIVTKSISRFARNTVDSLKTIRELKSAGIEIYFVKDDIFTFDSKGEFVITLLSCLAQEESRNISENVRWGKRKAFSDGKYFVAYSSFLGYDKGEEQPLKINEKEAKLVRLIYLLFLEGRTSYYIAKLLNELSVPTPSGKNIWRFQVVESILTNEKYKGDALLQKKYTIDYLSKKMVKNNGELPKYYVSNGHPAIIPRDIHDYVQTQLKARHTEDGRKYSGHHTLSHKIICRCGNYYRKINSNHKDKYPYQ